MSFAMENHEDSGTRSVWTCTCSSTPRCDRSTMGICCSQTLHRGIPRQHSFRDSSSEEGFRRRVSPMYYQSLRASPTVALYRDAADRRHHAQCFRTKQQQDSGPRDLQNYSWRIDQHPHQIEKTGLDARRYTSGEHRLRQPFGFGESESD